MKYKLSLLIALYSCLLLNAQQTVTIKGTIAGDDEGYKKIYIDDHESKDSVTIVNHAFSIVLPYKTGFSKALYTEYAYKKTGGQRFFIVIADKPGTITIENIDLAKGIESGNISGLQANLDFRLFEWRCGKMGNDIEKGLEKKYPGVVSMYSRDGKPIDPQTDARAAESLAAYKEQIVPLIANFVKEYPDSYASVYILDSTAKSFLDAPTFEKIFNTLSKKQQASELGVGVSNYISGLKQSANGKYIQAFSLKTPDNKTVSSKELRGKYVLIDFWASWCLPCIQSFPHLKEVYQKYKSEKFEILSISTDKNETAWLKAVKKYSLPWLQAVDDRESVGNNFGVSGIPDTFLIGPDGKILARGEDIEKKLAEVFGK